MTTFNIYFKILKKRLPVIMVYMTIFIIISIAMTMTTGNKENSSFTPTKTKIAFYDNDQSHFSNDLKKKIETIAEIVPLEDTEYDLKDSLFFRKINAIIRIDKGFSESILAGNPSHIEINSIPNTYDTYYLEIAINNYIGSSVNYAKHSNLTETEIIQKLENHTKASTQVEFLSAEASSDIQLTRVYFNYFNYILFAIIILAIGATMSSFNQIYNRRRMTVAPISVKRINLELTLGHIVFCMMILGMFIGIWAIIKPTVFQDIRMILFIANAICITLAILSIAFLIGITIKDKEAQNEACNIISLGTSFISGIFVPIEVLNSTVLAIANFTPSFWFVKANTLIQEVSSLQFETIKPILSCMGIQIVFAITFWFISLVVSKYKRTSNS